MFNMFKEEKIPENVDREGAIDVEVFLPDDTSIKTKAISATINDVGGSKATFCLPNHDLAFLNEGDEVTLKVFNKVVSGRVWYNIVVESYKGIYPTPETKYKECRMSIK